MKCYFHVKLTLYLSNFSSASGMWTLSPLKHNTVQLVWSQSKHSQLALLSETSNLYDRFLRVLNMHDCSSYCLRFIVYLKSFLSCHAGGAILMAATGRVTPGTSVLSVPDIEYADVSLPHWSYYKDFVWKKQGKDKGNDLFTFVHMCVPGCNCTFLVSLKWHACLQLCVWYSLKL